MEPIHRRVAGLDVHRMKPVITVLIEGEDGSITKHTREFGGFKRDMKALIGWLTECRVELVILESTGIYWKSVFASLSAAGIPAWVVNAHHVKHVPGRKTDVADSEWLAQLGRFGLVRGSFIPPKDLRELRLVSRYRKKVADQLAAEKNRRPLLLDDAGIKPGGVVADINGVSAANSGQFSGKPGTPHQICSCHYGLLFGPPSGLYMRPHPLLQVGWPGKLQQCLRQCFHLHQAQARNPLLKLRCKHAAAPL